ncbi:hypothetical protein [Cyclobacterium sp. SYSU L10401]|uniref:hypothetical protein n=1 Tax=Cyclobacterium sp. SYSU L10401 TaxID=2678657 RepID=UPI0013D81932|nr:hypothetical protein [Cyclobacterium sp. SYSU L10401]
MRLFFFFILLTAINITFSLAQSPFVPFDRDYYQLIERYEIKQGFFTDAFHSGHKPYSRDELVGFLENYKASYTGLSEVDDFNLNFLLQDSWEYVSDTLPFSRNTVGKHFYQRPADFYYHRDRSLDVHVNPVLYLMGGVESGEENLRFRNTRGLSVRGSIDRKIGFYTLLTTTDLVFPSWIKRYVNHQGAIPGQGFWKRYGEQGYSFFSARGHLNFNATEHIQVIFGHDSHFIGEGFRSFVLSDFSNPFVFLKLNTHIGKINFTNLWGQMTADIITDRGFPTDGRYPQKWFSFHRLGINLGNRFNLGVFESVMASQMDWNYLNPVIFYRWVEHQLGTPDKVMLGTDFKWHPGNGMQVYGQFVLDEFVFNEFFGISGKGSSRNKHGFQLGYKYVEVAGINNLDVQVEYNHARPFTYQEKFAYQSYTNYRIPLTHPLGANFREFMGSVTYQPLPKFRLKGIFLYQMKGEDPDESANYGGDILKSRLETSTALFGNFIGQGLKQENLMFTIQADYMLRHNLFLDFSHTLRKSNGGVNPIQDTAFGQLALRLNMGRFDPHF